MTKTNYINIVKKGGFYTVYNNDCYIINYLFNYKIVNNKTGFPISSINKEKPRMFDEWQMYPVVWDSIRTDVDHTALKGQYILTG